MIQASDAARHLSNKQRLYPQLKALADAPPAQLRSCLESLYTSDANWRGSHPLNALQGIEAIATTVWDPLHRALPDMERRDEIFMAGHFEGKDFVGAMGHFCGTFEQPWLGIPASGKSLFLRYGEVHEVENGRIVQSSCLWDVLDVMRQAGFWPVAPSTGLEGRWSGPLSADGVLLRETDPIESARNLAQTLAMHKTLGDHDDSKALNVQALMNMPQREYWHPKMMWYGPSGIGTTRGLRGFVEQHQMPFRVGFPGRKGGNQWDSIPEEKSKQGGGHYVRIGDGPYSLSGGWPSVHAIHSGPNFMGLAATGKAVNMRVMDFYRHDESLIRENWIPLDIIDLLLQMGVNVFERMAPFFDRSAN